MAEQQYDWARKEGHQSCFSGVKKKSTFFTKFPVQIWPRTRSSKRLADATKTLNVCQKFIFTVRDLIFGLNIAQVQCNNWIFFTFFSPQVTEFWLKKCRGTVQVSALEIP